MKNKRVFPFIIILASIVAVIILLGPKIYLKILQKKVDRISVGQTSIKENSVTLNVKVDISEKWIPVLIDSMDYKTEIYNTIISQGVTHLDPAKRHHQSIIFPVKLNNELLKKNIKSHQGDSTVVKIYMRQYMNLPVLGTKSIDIVKNIHMRIPIIPDVKIEDVKVLKLGLDNMRMLVTLSVDNPNNIDFTIKHMKSVVQVKDYASSYSEEDKNVHIKKFGVSIVQIPVHTDMKHEAKALLNIIKGDTEWPYYLKSEMVLDPSDKQIDDIKMESEKKGIVDVKTALKAMKNKEHVGIGENN